MISLRRPRATVIAVAVAVSAGIGVGLSGCGAMDRGVVNTVGKVAFDSSLAVPPLAASTIDSAGRRVFDLTSAHGVSSFLPGRPTTTWGFNGDYLGPTLRAERDETVLVNVHNGLDESTTVHWHGMQLPARMDGGPHQMIAVGGDWAPIWTIDQPAATLWYHPPSARQDTRPRHQGTGRHVHRR